MQEARLNKSWKQYPTKQQLYVHLSPIFKTNQIRRTTYSRHCRRSKGRLISDTLLWTNSHGQAGVQRPAKTYVQQLCTDTCSQEDLLIRWTIETNSWHDMMMMNISLLEYGMGYMIHKFTFISVSLKHQILINIFLYKAFPLLYSLALT